MIVNNQQTGYGCFHCNAIFSDTIYITDYGIPIFLSSRYINSNLNFLLNDIFTYRIYSNNMRFTKSEYKNYTEKYTSLLSLRKIEYKMTKTKSKTIIEIQKYDVAIKLVLNKKNLKRMLKKLINGGSFEEMFIP